MLSSDLLPKEIEARMPRFYENDGPSAIAMVRYTSPDGAEWYATEWNPHYQEFFGLAQGDIRYFSFEEIELAKAERDTSFNGCPLFALVKIAA